MSDGGREKGPWSRRALGQMHPDTRPGCLPRVAQGGPWVPLGVPKAPPVPPSPLGYSMIPSTAGRPGIPRTQEGSVGFLRGPGELLWRSMRVSLGCSDGSCWRPRARGFRCEVLRGALRCPGDPQSTSRDTLDYLRRCGPTRAGGLSLHCTSSPFIGQLTPC